ncbi:MAG: DUF1997 domain-containing protein [Spirulina sp. SIO3F2]|nr:DUF1997 domain-containing protein [Spirulina sp. SIO3F2]
MKIRCVASEPVTIPVTEAKVPIQHYLRQPQRLVHAIADPRLMDVLDGDRYRLRMHPLNLLELYHFQPTVILKVQANSQGVVNLHSEDCTIQGIDYINDRFNLNVDGKLMPVVKDAQTYLKGLAVAEVTVDIPPFLMLAPLPILEKAGEQLVKGVLGRIKQRLLSQLLKDYRAWAQDAPTALAPTAQSSLSIS